MATDTRRLIVGRAAELEMVRRLVDGRDRGGILVLEGEAGIGKTTLLDVAAARAREQGVHVLRAAAEDVYAEQPFGLLHQAFASGDPTAAAELAALAGSPPSAAAAGTDPLAILGGGSSVPSSAVDWVLDRVESVGDGQPVLLLLDDLQWADPVSVLSIGPIARRGLPLGLVMLLGLRPQPRTEAVDRLFEALEPLAPAYFAIPPLTVQEVDVLVELHAGGTPSPALRDLAARVGGNPFYLVELVDSLRAEERLVAGEVAVDVDGEQVPGSLRRTLLRRARLLGDEVGNVLRAAAVLGRTLHMDEVAAVSGRAVPDLAGPIRKAVGAGILVDDDGRLRFRHDLLRESLLDETPPAVRAALHREVARVLREADAPPERIAQHLIHGMTGHDPAALRLVREIAMATAPTVAVDLLRIAVDRCPQSDPQAADLAADYAEALFWSSKPDEAERVAREALGWVDDPSVRVRLGGVRSHALFMLGDPRRAVDAWDELVDARALSSAEEAETALALLFATDLAEAALRARRALADPDLDLTRQTVAHGVMAWIDTSDGRFQDAMDHADAAVAAFRNHGSAWVRTYTPHLFRAVVLDSVGRPAEALDALDDELRARAGVGSAATIVLHHAAAAVILFRSGRWDEALAEADAGIGASRDGAMRLGLGWLVAVKAMVLLRRNEIDAAEEACGVLEEAAFGPQLGQEWVGWARALIYEARGDAASGAVMLGTIVDMAAAMGVRSVATYVGPDAVRLALAVGDRGTAEAIASSLDWVSAGDPAPMRGAARYCAGLVADDAGALLDSAQRFAAVPRPYEAARAVHDAASALARSGHLDEARTEAGRALDRYLELGCELDAARLRADLRGLGVRVRAGAAPRATEGWASLTPSERAVVSLVAEGLSNAAIAERLFVSRRTVESHLARVYPKLGFSSRVELVRRVAERGGLG